MRHLSLFTLLSILATAQLFATAGEKLNLMLILADDMTYSDASDRTESVDLAAEHPGLVDKMAAAWETWARTHDVLPRQLGTSHRIK